MLAEVTVQETEVTVYTVPSGKSGIIEAIINPLVPCNVWIKINNTVLFDEVIEEQVGQKLICSGGDVVKIGTDATVNVFISGMEV